MRRRLGSTVGAVSGRRCVGGLFVVALAASVAGLGLTPWRTTSAPALVPVLIALSAVGYLTGQLQWSKVNAVLDMGMGLALVAVWLSGPWVALLVLLIPDVIRLAHRRRRFWNLGLLANVTSYAVAALAGSVIVDAAPAGIIGAAGTLLVAGVVMASVNYLIARLVPATICDRQPATALLRREFLALAPVELAMIAAGAASALLLDGLGVAVLGVFAALVYMPEVTVALLLRAPSAASLSIDAAAAVYRGALADELGLDRADRRRIEQVDALVQRRSHPGPGPANPLTIMRDAFEVSICAETAPRQPAFTASERAQVVLVARRWAQLTARLTPALTHAEALTQLHGGSVAVDAPRALAAVARIVEREHPLTAHLAGVPRLHRAPLPRRARQGVLPRTLARLAV